MFKVTRGIAPVFMQQVFASNPNAYTEDISEKTRFKSSFCNHSNPKKVNYGLETLRSLGPIVWNMVPTALKNITSLPLFKTEIKKSIPLGSSCRLCKNFIPQLGYL